MATNKTDDIKRYKEADVLQLEREKVFIRRKKAGFAVSENSHPEPVPDDDEVVSVNDECVGLALSGGGVRSAAFSLGLLQAFHKYGVLRFVDYVSAVSGGTYAAAMLTKSVPDNEDYEEDKFDLAQTETGKQEEKIQEVSRRTNFLYRVDIFLSRYIPNLLMNLVPRAATIIAVGAGIAFLWRCLDFHSVRDHFSAIGLGYDYVPAIAPAICMGIIWVLAYLIGILVESAVLLRSATRLMWLTIACIAVGCAVLVGNGDISLGAQTLSGNDGERISWLHDFSKYFAAVVGIGCLPFLAPRALLKSGVAPGHFTQSWLFYYASLAMFLGVPLLSIGWFAKENISSFNDARGAEILLGDLRDRRGFVDFAAGKYDGYRIEFTDLGLIANVDVSNTTRSGKSNAPISSTAHEKFIKVFEEQDKSRDRLFVGKIFPNDEQRIDTEYDSPRVISGRNADGNNRSLGEWTTWRYFRPFTHGIRSLGYYVLSGDIFRDNSGYEELESPYGESIRLSRKLRSSIQGNLKPFNDDLNHRLFFDFKKYVEKYSTPQASIKINKSELPDALVEQLKLIAANIDEWETANNTTIPPELMAVLVNVIPTESLSIFLPEKSTEANTLHPHQEKFADINRGLLESVFPNIIRHRGEVLRTTLINYDQRHRLLWFCGSLVVALGMGWYVNPNKTGLHGYYRDRLAATYFPDNVDDSNSSHPDEKTAALSEATSDKQGLPYLLFNASTPTESHWRIADQLETPFSSFLLSRAFIGNEKLGYIETSELKKQCPSIADTIAISGAALNPAYFVQHIVSLIMNVVNLRTGQYLPNPKTISGRPSRTSMLKEFWQSLRRTPEEMSNILLTDGGYVENLGIEELLKRRCRVIFVCDAGHDPDHHFDDFSKVLRRLQSHYGIRICDTAPAEQESNTKHSADKKDHDEQAAVDGNSLQIPANLAAPVLTGKENTRERQEKLKELAQKPTEQKHFFVARILYPACGEEHADGTTDHPEQEGLLVYVKPSLTGDEGIRLFNFARRSSYFPHEPTQDQSFSESQFNAYLQLGFHAGSDVCRDLNKPNQSSPLWRKNIRPGARVLLQKLFPDNSSHQVKENDLTKDKMVQEIEEFVTANQERRNELLEKFDVYGARFGLAAHLIAEHHKTFEEAIDQQTKLEKFAWNWDETSLPSIAKIFCLSSTIAKKQLATEWLEIMQLNGISIQTALDVIQKTLLEENFRRYSKQLVTLVAQESHLHTANSGVCYAVLKEVMEDAKDDRTKKEAADAILLMHYQVQS